MLDMLFQGRIYKIHIRSFSRVGLCTTELLHSVGAILNQQTKEKKILAFNIYAPLSMVSQGRNRIYQTNFVFLSNKTNFLFFFVYVAWTNK